MQMNDIELCIIMITSFKKEKGNMRLFLMSEVMCLFKFDGIFQRFIFNVLFHFM